MNRFAVDERHHADQYQRHDGGTGYRDDDGDVAADALLINGRLRLDFDQRSYRAASLRQGGEDVFGL